MKKSLFLLLFCLLYHTLFAQNPLDTLQKSLENIAKQPNSYKKDSLLINRIGYLLYFINDKNQRRLYEDSMLNIAKKSNWKKAIPYYHYRFGYLNIVENNLYSAFNNLEKALIGFSKLKDDESMLRVNNKFIAMISWNMIENDIPPSVQSKYLKYMLEASKLAVAKKDTAIWANIEVTISGYFVFVLKDYKNSYLHADLVMKELEKKNINEWFDYYYICILGKSICLLNTNQEKKGLEMIQKIIKICEKQKDSGPAKYVLSQIGAFVGRYFLEKKDYKTALKYALIGEKNNTFLNFPYFVNVLNKVLYQSYKGVNQPAKAFQYLEKVKLYEENSEAKKLNENYTEWQLKYEDEKQKTQIKTLENEKLKRANERQDLFRNILIVSVLVGLFITIYVFQNNKKLRLKNQELRQKNNEILGAMSKGQTIERKRVASELHDNLNTKLVALKWRIEALDISKYPSDDQKILTDFTRVLDDIYMDVRLISHNLLPAELETMGLIAALQKLMNNLSNQRITFHFLTEGIEQRFNPIFENELYNITLELINNILKHSQASQAWVSLTMQDDKISLTVSDNGKGIDLSRLADGVGLRNVHSRVENLNGKIQITNGRHSNENANGTNVQVDLTV